MKIEQIANKQIVVSTKKEVVFQSYDSKIATYNKETGVLILGKDWDYSRTTLRYLKRFINEYTPFVYETKAKFENLNNNDIIYDENSGGNKNAII